MPIAVERMMENCLLELSEKKTLKKITVQDVMDATGVSRQTFYNHYRDKYDLINQTWHNQIVGQGQLDEDSSLYGYIEKALNRFAAHKNFVIQAEELQKQNSLLEYMVWHNYNNYRTLFLRNHLESEITEKLDYAMHFNAYGVAFIHLQWIRGGMQLSVEEMARFEIQCIPEVIKDFLREDAIASD